MDMKIDPACEAEIFNEGNVIKEGISQKLKRL